MNPLLRKLLSRVMAPAGDDGTDLGGTDTAVTDDPNAAGGTGAAEDRGDVVDPAINAANLQAVIESGAGAADPGAGEPGEDGDGEGADGGKSVSQSVPHARFNEVNTRKKELENENEQLRRELAAARAPTQAPAPSTAAAPAPAAQFDPDAMEQEYVAALIEGDAAKASKIRREINNHLVAEAEARADAKAEQRSQVALLRDEVTVTMQAHPWLNTEEGADALELIVAARDAGIARGQAPHVALRSAVAKIAPKFAPASAAAAAPPAGASTATPVKQDTRSADAVKRGAADSMKQPPSLQTAGVGNRAAEAQVDIEDLTDEQFANLSEAEKKRMRGD